jgi:hypothetical protein
LPRELLLEVALFLFGSEMGIDVALTVSGHYSASQDVKMAAVSTGAENLYC